MDWNIATALIASAVALVIGLSESRREREATRRIERLANARANLASGSKAIRDIDALIGHLLGQLRESIVPPTTPEERVAAAEQKGMRIGIIVSRIAMIVSLLSAIAAVVLTFW